MLLFKALSSKTRREMLKLLMKTDYHVSGLAKALGISVPVAAKHVKILEDAELVTRKTFGKTHVLAVNKAKLYDALETFSEDYEIERIHALESRPGDGQLFTTGKEYASPLEPTLPVEGDLCDIFNVQAIAATENASFGDTTEDEDFIYAVVPNGQFFDLYHIRQQDYLSPLPDAMVAVDTAEFSDADQHRSCAECSDL